MDVKSQNFDEFDNFGVELLIVNFEMPRLDIDLALLIIVLAIGIVAFIN